MKNYRSNPHPTGANGHCHGPRAKGENGLPDAARRTLSDHKTKKGKDKDVRKIMLGQPLHHTTQHQAQKSSFIAPNTVPIEPNTVRQVASPLSLQEAPTEQLSEKISRRNIALKKRIKKILSQGLKEEKDGSLSGSAPIDLSNKKTIHDRSGSSTSLVSANAKGNNKKLAGRGGGAKKKKKTAKSAK